MVADPKRLQSALRTCERALHRVADYRLDPALDQRLRDLGERKEWLSKAEHDELLALVVFTQQRSLEKLEAETALQEREEEETIRRQHVANPIRERPTSAVNPQSFAASLRLLARFKAVRVGQGLTLAEVAQRMGIDAPALSRLETGKVLNPTLATLLKWAEAFGQKLDVDFLSP